MTASVITAAQAELIRFVLADLKPPYYFTNGQAAPLLKMRYLLSSVVQSAVD